MCCYTGNVGLSSTVAQPTCAEGLDHWPGRELRSGGLVQCMHSTWAPGTRWCTNSLCCPSGVRFWSSVMSYLLPLFAYFPVSFSQACKVWKAEPQRLSSPISWTLCVQIVYRYRMLAVLLHPLTSMLLGTPWDFVARTLAARHPAPLFFTSLVWCISLSFVFSCSTCTPCAFDDASSLVPSVRLLFIFCN